MRLGLSHDGSDLLAEQDRATGTILRRYVYGPGTDEPLVWFEGADIATRRWLHADERGSIVAVSDDKGNLLQADSYDEFGIPAPTNLGRFGYTGQKWMPSLGL